jgi:hypothetical protein
MQTVTENLKQMVDQIRTDVQDLLLNHSKIYMWNEPGSMVITGRPYAYRELSEDGRQLQAKLLEHYQRFQSILEALLRGQPRDTLKALADTQLVLLNTIEQQHTSARNVQEAFNRANEALTQQESLLARLYDPSAGDAVFVPDTNALLYNPALEQWKFPGAPTFTLVFTPTVLSELDELKINHRNVAVRDKAERLIRQIKEYRRRGRLADGVLIVAGVSTLQTIAMEPKLEDSLPWLDPTNNDDRFIAAVLEVMRLRPRAPVVLISRDINLQNKAEFAGLPFLEPPDPV